VESQLSYRNFITKQVARAFDLVKDLAVVGTLFKEPPKEFDFSTGAFPTVTAVQTAVKVVFLTQAKKSPKTNNLVCNVLLKAADAVDLNTYDSLTVSGVVWRLGPLISSNGFVYEIELQRNP